MGDANHLELPPNSGIFIPGTPSGLTPTTRSEAEAAFTLNSIAQTDSAAPTTPPGDMDSTKLLNEENMSEAQKAWRRPAGMNRTSSANYETALKKAHKDHSLSSVLSTSTDGTTEGGRPGNITGQTVANPTGDALSVFPPPGQGVVPLRPGVGIAPQVEAMKKAKPSGLSLGQLGRQQSWNAQDFKHVYSAGLMEPISSDAGYASGAESKDA
ncbi:hypothetical protein K504DRAFT_449990 [Pleomassaria siparia CBS 279.74]|uniref:Uncharacterized protein n=1 Tax=Pleomassaria siparia CBS 279.74 TaxID=1314801 RepID=A0A6G1KLN1_9PLEO|nr:hypothetical protein K504DRAFT_449990 [Pleomassaria siparia CBS 279.74]